MLRDLGHSIAHIRRKLRNHFKKFHFFDRGLLSDDYFSADVDPDFLAVVRNDGLNAALSLLERNTRIRYLRRLKHHERWRINPRLLIIGIDVGTLLFLRYLSMTLLLLECLNTVYMAPYVCLHDRD